MAAKQEVHFYPGSKKLAVFGVERTGMVTLFAITAVGGPESGGYDPRMAQIPTTTGRFIIGKIQAYRTASWTFSQIAWGTKLRDMPAKRDVWYEISSGKWGSIMKSYKITREQIVRQYQSLYGESKVPNVWVFNDFGPVAIRYFEDKNKNRKLDAGEKLSGEMIHTTPGNEAATAQGRPVVLGESHGCIHIKPSDRAILMNGNVFKVGTPLIIHRYSEPFPYVGNR